MKCELCRGACCETFSLPIVETLPIAGDVIQVDLNRWLTLHATVGAEKLTFECRCMKLTDDGRCGIYDRRPVVCRTYLAGGADCLEAVRTRRSQLEYSRIRDDGDPVVIGDG